MNANTRCSKALMGLSNADEYHTPGKNTMTDQNVRHFL